MDDGCVANIAPLSHMSLTQQSQNMDKVKSDKLVLSPHNYQMFTVIGTCLVLFILCKVCLSALRFRSSLLLKRHYVTQAISFNVFVFHILFYPLLKLRLVLKWTFHVFSILSLFLKRLHTMINLTCMRSELHRPMKSFCALWFVRLHR